MAFLQKTYARNLQLIMLVKTPIYGATDFSASQSQLMCDNICELINGFNDPASQR